MSRTELDRFVKINRIELLDFFEKEGRKNEIPDTGSIRYGRSHAADHPKKHFVDNLSPIMLR